MRKITQDDAGTLYAMKVLKKATLKGESIQKMIHRNQTWTYVTDYQ